MKKQRCSLCKQIIPDKKDQLCPKCRLMDDQIEHLLKSHIKVGRKYLIDKFNAIAATKDHELERRQKTYIPPRGPHSHTPERRIRIRRIKTLANSPKRRKSD